MYSADRFSYSWKAWKQPDIVQEAYDLMFVDKKQPITERTCICTISCQLVESTQNDIMICEAHSHGHLHGFLTSQILHIIFIFFAGQRFQA